MHSFIKELAGGFDGEAQLWVLILPSPPPHLSLALFVPFWKEIIAFCSSAEQHRFQNRIPAC